VGGGLEVTGSVTLTVDGRTIEVTGTGTRVRAEIGGLDAGRPSLRLATSGYALARRLSRALDARALTVEITRDGRTVAELGAGVRGGTLARLLGIARVRIVRGPR
jgi:hypothetical protein